MFINTLRHIIIHILLTPVATAPTPHSIVKIDSMQKWSQVGHLPKIMFRERPLLPLSHEQKRSMYHSLAKKATQSRISKDLHKYVLYVDKFIQLAGREKHEQLSALESDQQCMISIGGFKDLVKTSLEELNKQDNTIMTHQMLERQQQEIKKSVARIKENPNDRQARMMFKKKLATLSEMTVMRLDNLCGYNLMEKHWKVQRQVDQSIDANGVEKVQQLITDLGAGNIQKSAQIEKYLEIFEQMYQMDQQTFQYLIKSPTVDYKRILQTTFLTKIRLFSKMLRSQKSIEKRGQIVTLMRDLTTNIPQWMVNAAKSVVEKIKMENEFNYLIVLEMPLLSGMSQEEKVTLRQKISNQLTGFKKGIHSTMPTIKHFLEARQFGAKNIESAPRTHQQRRRVDYLHLLSSLMSDFNFERYPFSKEIIRTAIINTLQQSDKSMLEVFQQAFQFDFINFFQSICSKEMVSINEEQINFHAVNSWSTYQIGLREQPQQDEDQLIKRVHRYKAAIDKLKFPVEKIMQVSKRQELIQTMKGLQAKTWFHQYMQLQELMQNIEKQSKSLETAVGKKYSGLPITLQLNKSIKREKDLKMDIFLEPIRQLLANLNPQARMAYQYSEKLQLIAAKYQIEYPPKLITQFEKHFRRVRSYGKQLPWEEFVGASEIIEFISTLSQQQRIFLNNYHNTNLIETELRQQLDSKYQGFSRLPQQLQQILHANAVHTSKIIQLIQQNNSKKLPELLSQVRQTIVSIQLLLQKNPGSIMSAQDIRTMKLLFTTSKDPKQIARNLIYFESFRALSTLNCAKFEYAILPALQLLKVLFDNNWKNGFRYVDGIIQQKATASYASNQQKSMVDTLKKLHSEQTQYMVVQLANRVKGIPYKSKIDAMAGNSQTQSAQESPSPVEQANQIQQNRKPNIFTKLIGNVVRIPLDVDRLQKQQLDNLAQSIWNLGDEGAVARKVMQEFGFKVREYQQLMKYSWSVQQKSSQSKVKANFEDDGLNVIQHPITQIRNFWDESD